MRTRVLPSFYILQRGKGSGMNIDIFLESFKTMLGVFLSIWYFLIPLAFLVYLKRQLPKIIGYVGEKQVRKRLEQLDPTEYMVVHDVMLRLTDEKTSQIDHVVVSMYGIFVIETKNYG
ncbi:nuclease-related domain-containing protein [Ammoniphilus resinae]|nr:nuclease-related domain-containing protein [Ammoniphilus resinae]